MRIAMLGQKNIPSREGGIEVVVGELSTRMAALGHSVTCYNRTSKNSERISSYIGVQIKKVFTIERRGLAAVSSSFFACLFAGFGKYDVVHIHAEGPAFFSFIPKLLGKRVIVTVHGLDWNRAKWGRFASWYIKHGEKNAVNFADEIIVLSQSMKDYFKKTYNREVVFIPNGVAKPVIRDVNEIKKWGLEKDSYILYLGRIVPEKGGHYLIESFKKIKTDKKLVIAGQVSDTAWYGKKLKEMAADDDRIIFTGFVYGSVLEELYSNAYIFCLPSDLEGMSLSLLEAMSYGNCCLVSNIAECVEVVEEKAITFKKGDTEDLKTKLTLLLGYKDKVESYRNDSANFICSKYNWDDVVDRTLNLYMGK